MPADHYSSCSIGVPSGLNSQHVLNYLRLFEAKFQSCNLGQCHPRPSSAFMQDRSRVSSCRTQKNVINCSVLMRVAPNLGATTGIQVNFELLCNLTNCCFDRLFIRLDGAPRKVPHVGAWDRKSASVIPQLHEDSAIWSLKDHRRGNGSAHLRINSCRRCQLVSPNATRLLVLLHHKVCRRIRLAIGAAQHGHRGSLLTRAAISRRRTVAIEFGMCRSGRRGGASGSVTVG